MDIVERTLRILIEIRMKHIFDITEYMRAKEDIDILYTLGYIDLEEYDSMVKALDNVYKE